MASQAESVVSLGSTRANRSHRHAVVTELSGSGFLCVLVLLLHAWIGNAIVEALIVAPAMIALMELAGVDLTPIVTFARIGREELSPDQGAAHMAAQLVGAAIGGCIVACIVVVPASSVEVFGATTYREAAIVFVVVLAAVFLGRQWRVTAIVVPLLMATGCAAGSAWLGNPLLAIGSAFGSIGSGTIAHVGPLLLAQTVPALIAALIVFVIRGAERAG